jgi:hypothetical protein
VWDFDASRLFGEHQVEFARQTGALVQLQFALALAGRREMPAPLHGLRAVFGYD